MNRKPWTQLVRRCQLLLGSLGGLGLLSTSVLGQTPPRLTPLAEERPAANVQQAVGANFEQIEAVEHLTRGPLHEAFAEPYEADPRPSPLVPQQPPEAVNEVPPEYRPDGENIVWVPGYWSWDDDRSDFIWISGVWRDVPPDHQWVPGYWSQASRGYQYISGFWASTQVAELEYLPPPPQSLEQGPSSPAPGETYFYIPGNWVYASNDYQWQPGYWSVNHESWVWIPAHYVWTPRGCVYQAGYWDYDIPYRGVVFTPVYYQQPVYRSAQYVYRPQYVVDTGPELFVHMFVRPNYGHYYYGDYYDSRYSSSYQSWSTYYQGPRYYDPFYTNYRVRGRASNNLNLLSWIANQHQVFVQNDRYRPAATIAAQRNFFNASRRANLDPTILRLANLGDSLDSLVLANNANVNFQPLNQSDVDRIVRTGAPLRELGNQRRQVESSQNVNANVDMRVSLSEVRQQMEAAEGADASAQANATADANLNSRPGNRADRLERNSPARDLLGERQPRGEARRRDNANPAEDATDKDRTRPGVIGDAIAETSETGRDAIAEANEAGRDAVAEARETGRDALLRPGQEPNARGDDNARRPELGRDSEPKDPGVRINPAIPNLGDSPREGTRPNANDAQPNNRPGSILPGLDSDRPDRPGDIQDRRTPGAGMPEVGTPDRSTPGADKPDRSTTELDARARQGRDLRDLQNRRDNPSVQPLGSTPGDIDLRNRQGAASRDRNNVGQRLGATDRGNRSPLESNQRQNQSSTQGSSRRPDPNPAALGATGNSQTRSGARDAGSLEQMRPARPQNWPSTPRRELGRGVPEIPQIQSLQPSRGKSAGSSTTPGRGKAPRSVTPANPPATSTPDVGDAAPKASQGNKGGSSGEGKEKGKKKDD